MPLWTTGNGRLLPPTVLAQGGRLGDNALSRRWSSAIPDVISSRLSAVRSARDGNGGRGGWKTSRATDFRCVHGVPNSTMTWSTRTRRISRRVVLAIGQSCRPYTRGRLGVARCLGLIALPPCCGSVLELSSEIVYFVLE